MTNGILRASLCAACALALSSCSQSDSHGGDPSVDPPERAINEYVIDNESINESSGLARSHWSGDVLWTHNDSGGSAEAYALDGQGRFLGTLAVVPAVNLDWEDMTSFVEDGTPRLLLADIGDNSAFRPLLQLYIVDEPDLTDVTPPFELNAPVVRLINMSYPDGPRDAEAIAVDANEAAIYIVSKRDAVPKLYRIDLNPIIPIVIAESLGEINIPRAPEGSDNADSFNFVTSMDISDDSRSLVLVTYLNAYRYTRGDDETWQDALQHEPETIDLPDYSQIEAVSFESDAGAIHITSENLPAPLARVPLP